MTKKLSLAIFAFSISSLVSHSFAQSDTDENLKDKNQNIIITKKGDTKEKYTIVIDGNNVTINGKPVDEFTSDNLDIEKIDCDDCSFKNIAPFVIGNGDSRSFDRNFMRSISNNKAFLGVMTETVKDGAQITDVSEESPAEKTGLKEDDIITKVGDDKITGPDDLYKAIGKYKPEDKVNITYKRDGKDASTNATLGTNTEARVFSWNGDDGQNFNFQVPQMPEMPQHNFAFSWNNKPRLGIQLQDTDDESGVKVIGVDEESAAEKAGLKEDDIITKVNATDIKSTEDLKKITKDAKPGDSFTVTYKRNGEVKTTTVRFPKELKTIDL